MESVSCGNLHIEMVCVILILDGGCLMVYGHSKGKSQKTQKARRDAKHRAIWRTTLAALVVDYCPKAWAQGQGLKGR